MKTKKEIIKDLEKTGFPLEVFVASELEKKDWMVYNGYLYIDEETGQSRELDLHGVKVDLCYANNIIEKVDIGNANKLVSHLVVQCKKSDKPWIFFDNGGMRWPTIPDECLKSKKKKFNEMLFDDLEIFGLKDFCLKDAILHKSYHESFSKPNQNSKIYEALVTLVKATKYIKKRYGLGKYTLHYFMPIIVLDGMLWSASLNKNFSVCVKKVDNLFVVFETLPKLDNKGMSFEEEYVIEVITRKAFAKKLLDIQKDNKKLYKCWTNFINSIKRPDRGASPEESKNR
ncbi:MAG: hypothetical protein NTU58_02440 [Candidatus Nealsonbacteria bacterium]|nr:hypothetical protein [Candidatus Nealsonbacteria bacterium]